MRFSNLRLVMNRNEARIVNKNSRNVDPAIIFYKIQFQLYCTNRFVRSVLTKFQDATLQTEGDKSCNAAFNNAFQLG